MRQRGVAERVVGWGVTHIRWVMTIKIWTFPTGAVGQPHLADTTNITAPLYTVGKNLGWYGDRQTFFCLLLDHIIKTKYSLSQSTCQHSWNALPNHWWYLLLELYCPVLWTTEHWGFLRRYTTRLKVTVLGNDLSSKQSPGLAGSTWHLKWIPLPHINYTTKVIADILYSRGVESIMLSYFGSKKQQTYLLGPD